MSCLKLRSFWTGQHLFLLIREEAKYYEVTKSAPMFGNFNGWGMLDATTVKVLAFTPRQAAWRAYYRGVKPDGGFAGRRSSKQFAYYRVKQADKPDNHRHFKYYS